MEDKLNISIKNPCSEKFQDFKKNEKGGFCTSCKKNVIDFRTLSDKQIIDHFTKNEGRTCGVFKEEQIKSYSIQNTTFHSKRTFYKSVFGFTLLSFLSFKEGYSQNTKPKTEINKSNKKEKNSKKEVDQLVTKGTVSDANGGLPSASVVLKYSDTGVVTDFDGNFVFKEKLKVGDVLLVSFIGLKTKEVVVSNTAQVDIMMDSNMDTCIIMGEVSVDKVYKSKRTFLQKIKDIF